MVLRSIFGSKKAEVAGGWREMHDEKLYKLYSSPNIWVIVLRRRWMGYVKRLEIHKKCIRKPEGKRSLRKHRHIWEYNTKMDHKPILMMWIGVI